MPCIFCNSNEHNISRCWDPRIDTLYESIKTIYVNMMFQHPYNTEAQFKFAVNRVYTLLDLRAVCATRLHVASSRTKQQVIHSLYLYYSTRIYTPEEQRPWLQARQIYVEPDTISVEPDTISVEPDTISVEPDTIPDFAIDLITPPSPVTVASEASEASSDNDIQWYMDSTPTPMSLAVSQFERASERLTNVFRDFARESSQNLTLQTNVQRTIALVNEFISIRRNLDRDFIAVSQTKQYNIVPSLDENVETEEHTEDCAICLETISSVNLIELNCKHKFCGYCIKQTLTTHTNIICGPNCALCREPMTRFKVKNPEIYNLIEEHCSTLSTF